MQAKQVQLHATEFSVEMLDRFIFAVEGRKSNLYVVEKPLTAAKAMEYLGIGKTAFHNLINKGSIKPHFFPDLRTPFYFPSEMYDALKKS